MVKVPSNVLYRRTTPTGVLANTAAAQPATTMGSVAVQTVVRAQSTIAGSNQHWKNEPFAKKWYIEKLAAFATLVTIPAAVILEHPVTDYLLGAILVLHGYWGLHGMFKDYIKGKSFPKYANAALTTWAVIAFFGLAYFNYYDMGLSKAIKRVWAL